MSEDDLETFWKRHEERCRREDRSLFWLRILPYAPLAVVALMAVAYLCLANAR